MRALKNFLLVSSGFAVIFVGIALVSAVLTATVVSQLRAPKTSPISITN
jgi:hypothetical protein